MVNENELVEIIRYIDIYHNTTSIVTRNKTLKFLTLKLRNIIPDISSNKIIEIIEDFNPIFFIFENKSPKKLITNNSLSEFNIKCDKIIKELQEDKNAKDIIIYTDKKSDILSPEWLTSTEKKYYNNLNSENKKNINNHYDNMKANSNYDFTPFRIKVLISKLPHNIKIEIFEKLNSVPDNKYLNYVNNILKLPFGKNSKLYKPHNSSEFKNYILNCKNILDKEIFGHHKVKNEFLTLIASWIKKGSTHEFGNVIGITGPMGVGKTTLIKDGISKALNRKFYFISLAGVSSSSFLQGFNFTYEGSLFGEISRGLMETQCLDPIFFFDELDKVAHDGKGDEIINSLIHITDPVQNNTFHDRYFAGVPLDISKAVFVFSYNNKDKINPILRDRLHELVLNDFSVKEKVLIVNEYIVPKLATNLSLDINNLLIFKNNSIQHLVSLCKNSGIRTLKNILIRLFHILNLADMSEGEIILNVNQKFLKGKPPYLITDKLLEEIYNNYYGNNTCNNSEMMYV